MKTEIQMRRAEVGKNHFNLELNKNFYELNPDEVHRLHLCYLASGYNGRNKMGRSKLEQFWYYLQKGLEIYIKQLKKIQQF